MCEPINYDSTADITQLLSGFEAAARKRWGQNFLINRGARQKITGLLSLTADDEVWEIGGGLGAMTVLLLNKAAKVKVFEIDPVFQTILTNFYGKCPNFELIKGDVLKTWHTQPQPQASVKILGNLPYNISAAVIQNFTAIPLGRAVITVQKELGERMLAKPRTKAYSSFSVFCQICFRIKNEGILKGGSFFPVPNVDSMILSLDPLLNPDTATAALLTALLRASFAGRRKTLRNNWKNIGAIGLPADKFMLLAREAGFNDNGRAEEFPPQNYQQLLQKLKELPQRQR
jgi:16S rRNA (adenine1518-N6/adenine1519-N6)-dimethyltransferase